MSWHPHQVARWLRLALACVALALGTGASAHPLPGPQAAVAVLVERRAPAARLQARAPARTEAPRSSWPAEVHAGTSPGGVARASRLPGPSRRYFLLHRALLH
ncbi:hypothetical protein [Corallococcus carmarthensis]|uniref:hypothetical protein n=1 Tax=Corallococcus carmarthensis TaxID=2316728 RepID=UPI00148DF8AE|nr:hypothetical protein [Corallococcus carmarthensis]NOK21639.1 hypothetical protein [Corallococcus carmarthensis]